MRSLLTFFCLLFLAFCSTGLRAQYIYTLAGNGYGANTGSGGYTGDDGLADTAELNACTSVAFDGAGNIYIADRNNNVIRKVDGRTGIISTFAGNGTQGYGGDNNSAILAMLNQPYGVAADAAGNVYIADFGNNRIRKVNTAGKITTYAGTGTSGYSGDTGPATGAKLNNPTGVAVDTMGDVFIADAANNAVRMVDNSGVISTIAGTGAAGYSGDGGAAVSAKLWYPVNVATDPYNQVYIADYNNNVVRKVDTSGNISTFAGNNTPGHSGDNGPAASAQLHFPSGVAVFGFSDVYITDEGNNVVRHVNSSGTINDFAGNYTNGYTGDGGTALTAELSSPKGIAVNGLNQLFIADFDNNVVRVVKAQETGIGNTQARDAALKVYPNPSNGSFTITLPATGSDATITVTDMLGRTIETSKAPAPALTAAMNNIPAGNYIVNVLSGGNSYHARVQVW